MKNQTNPSDDLIAGAQIKKYSFFLTYNNESGEIYNGNSAIPSSDILYTIIEKYNSMLKFLSNIDVVNNRSLEEADNNLVYRGVDSKGRYQYVYGKNLVSGRKKSINNNFVTVHNNMDEIQRIINKGLGESTISKSFVFSSILLTELTFFLRLGKDIHFERNGTVGVLTLQRKHITLDDTSVTINVYIDKKVSTYTCTEEDQPILCGVLRKLYNNTKEDTDFIMRTQDGTRFTERILNNLLKKLGVSLKDIRNYGRNLLFLKNVFINLETSPVSNSKDINTLLVRCMQITGDALNHTDAEHRIYFSSSLLTVLNTVLLRTKKFKTFDRFLQEVIKGILES